MTATQTLNSYLRDLKKALEPLPEGDSEDIINEIESLVLATMDELGGSNQLEAVLADLGSPRELAKRYKAHIQEGAPLPLAVRIARGTAKGASKSLTYFVTFIGAVIGLGLIANGILKIFMPDTIGFWVGDGGVIVGYPGASTGYRDLLGYWLTPLALILGGVVLYFTRKLYSHLK